MTRSLLSIVASPDSNHSMVVKCSASHPLLYDDRVSYTHTIHILCKFLNVWSKNCVCVFVNGFEL